MVPYICHIYGPIYLNNYGLFICIALIIFTFFALRNPLRAKTVSREEFINIITLGVLLGFVGSRILYVITNLESFHSLMELFAFWEGGFSLLGGIITVALILPIYLSIKKIPVLPFGDLIGIYAPLAFGISRIGCFCAGCCYGTKTNLALGVMYTHPASIAPLYVRLHPTQLYDAASLIGIFFIMRFILQRLLKKPGQLLAFFLMAISLDRLIWDFLRADQEFAFIPQTFKFFSTQQWLSLGIFASGLILFFYWTQSTKHGRYHYESL